jgi:Predicted Fe-S oxidoreductases
MALSPIVVPDNYDYIGVYLTDHCHLSCKYCITKHHGATYGTNPKKKLTAQQWIDGLNRLVLPKDTPITFQGGEPFTFKPIWEMLEGIRHKVDIMTALPPFLAPDHFLKLKSLDWNKRPAPYPTIRVSYHRGQNDFRQLIPRIAQLQDLLSIGLYYLDTPATPPEEIAQVKALAKEYGVELRSKEFLGVWEGKWYGNFLYDGACEGVKKNVTVRCRNSVVPIAPDGTIFLCHSDLYFDRRERALGHILDKTFAFPAKHLPCENFGLCSECDVKVKTNRYQQFGYTSVNIEFDK